MFIALDLPEALRDGLAAWGRRELVDPALRVVPAESLHLTLTFLSCRPEGESEKLGQILAGLKTPAPTIRLGEPVAKPSARRARLLALPVESTGAVSLQAELERKLVEARLYAPEKRPFWPHLTVARVRSEGRGSKRPQPVKKLPGYLTRELLEPVRCVRTTLYRSELNPKGARYTPLAQVELSRGGRQ